MQINYIDATCCNRFSMLPACVARQALLHFCHFVLTLVEVLHSNRDSQSFAFN